MNFTLAKCRDYEDLMTKIMTSYNDKKWQNEPVGMFRHMLKNKESQV